jgi:hypothetical protein
MTMDIRQANTGPSSGAGRGIAETNGTGKLSNRIDVLFVNAGIYRFKPISMIDEAFFDAQFILCGPTELSCHNITMFGGMP